MPMMPTYRIWMRGNIHLSLNLECDPVIEAALTDVTPCTSCRFITRHSDSSACAHKELLCRRRQAALRRAIALLAACVVLDSLSSKSLWRPNESGVKKNCLISISITSCIVCRASCCSQGQKAIGRREGARGPS